ncbi:MAG TPA: TlpA disulfide reductase family protein [Bryobacteraceae bacterium]|nr:TlpA disulfide reductase family protein [Bryobacteraceae bacterium]
MRIEFVRLAAIATLAAALMLTTAPAAQEGEILRVSQPAPPFSFITEQGQRISPASFGGELLVINFWETACAPCVKELPSLTEFARAFRSKGVVVVAVAADADRESYQKFLADHHVHLETYRDPARRISRAFGANAFPETYLVQKGSIVGKVVGGTDWNGKDINSFVQEHLGRN